MRTFIAALCLTLAPFTSHAAPVLARSCEATADPVRCEVRRKEIAASIKEARQGSYIAQREVAFCLATGCHGAVRQDIVEACSWFNLVVNHQKADVTDRVNLRIYCAHLSEEEKASAKASASKP